VAILRAKVADAEVVATSKKAGVDSANTDAANQTVAAHPTWPYLVVAVIVAVGGYFVGRHLEHRYHPVYVDLPELGSALSVFALLYVLAQVIERLLVPVSWIGGGFLNWLDPEVSTSIATQKSVQRKRQAMSLALANADTAGIASAAQSAANANHEVEQYAANVTATSFGIACAAASIVVGYSGALLFVAAGLLIPAWLDLLLTSLAIAGLARLLGVLISTSGSKTRRPAEARLNPR
jgi:hypothetical protein